MIIDVLCTIALVTVSLLAIGFLAAAGFTIAMVIRGRREMKGEQER